MYTMIYEFMYICCIYLLAFFAFLVYIVYSWKDRNSHMRARKGESMADKHSMTLNLDAELNNRVSEAAAVAGCSKTEWIRDAILGKLALSESEESLKKIEAAWTVADASGRKWLAEAADMVRRVH